MFADYLPKIDPGLIVYIFSPNKLGNCVIILYPYFYSEMDIVCVICSLFLTPGSHFEDKNVFSVWKWLFPFQSQILLNLDFLQICTWYLGTSCLFPECGEGHSGLNFVWSTKHKTPNWLSADRPQWQWIGQRWSQTALGMNPSSAAN